jgi:hypothetical protein
MTTGHERGFQSPAAALIAFLAAGALGVGALALSPTAAADEQHTVQYQITGPGDAFSVIPDPGTPVYPPNDTTWVTLPWSQTVTVTGHPLVALNWTDKTGNHDCVITVDGKVAALTEHSPGRCAYQIPEGSSQAAPAGNPFLDELNTNGVSLPGKSPAETIAAGNQVCADLRGGASVLDEMSAVEKRFGFSQGTLFVSASTTHLCPNFAG